MNATINSATGQHQLRGELTWPFVSYLDGKPEHNGRT
jgi:hypothetical protein